MSVGPLERQLSVAVVTHNSACLFWSGDAWLHINQVQLGVLYQGLCPSESIRPRGIKEGIYVVCVPSASHFRRSSPIATGGWGWQAVSRTGLCKTSSVMKFLPQQESLSLQRARLIFETSKHVGVVYWIAVKNSDLKPIYHGTDMFF